MNEIVHAAALRPDQWQEVAEALRRRFGNVRVVLQAWNRGSSYPFLLVSSGWSPSALKTYAAYYAQLNPWRHIWSDMPFLTPVWTDAHVSNAELRTTEFYRDFLRLEGEADSGTTTKLVDDADRLATFGINYAGEMGEAMHGVLGPLIQNLAANMRRAIDANRVFYRSSNFTATGPSLLSALIDPAFVVDESCRLLAANDPAQKLMADGLLLRIGAQDRVRFADDQTHEVFSRRIRRACTLAPGDDAAHVENLPVDHPSGSFMATTLLVRQNFHSLVLRGVLPLFLPITVALVVLQPRPTRALSDELRRRHGLTEAEASVALALLDCSTLAKVGERLGISYETVRSHLRAAFAKTGTNQQKQLVALVLRLTDRVPPPPDGR